MVQFRFGLRRWAKSIRLTVLGLFAVELAFTVVGLALFGIADPDTYRTRLWQDGFDNGFNSAPMQPIFDMVNGKGYHVPLVWSSFITHFNLVTIVLSLFLLLTKTIMHIMKVFYPIISILLHGAELALWTFSVYGQASSDTIDPAHPSLGAPWYLTKDCKVANHRGNVHYCQQAKACFAIAILFVALLAVQVVIAVFSVFFAPDPAKLDQEAFVEMKQKEKREKKLSHIHEEEEQHEMVPIPLSPMTPRTKAFASLNGVPSRP